MYTTWCGQYVRALKNLAFEPVTIIGSMKKCCRGDFLDDKQLGNSFSPSAALKVKETYIFPKHWLVHVERLHCAVLYLCVVVPCFYRRLWKIWKGIPQSKTFLPWLLFSCCFVTVKAPGKLWWPSGVKTQNTTFLTIQKLKAFLCKIWNMNIS